MDKIAIIIVAAGSSRRMKRAKQLLPFGETTLLGHAIQEAKASGVNEVITVLGAYYEEIRSNIEYLNITLLKNKNWEQGIGSSIATGMSYILQENKKYKAVLLMVGDQPLINCSYLKRLVDYFYENPTEIIATKYPKSNGVPAIFPETYFEDLVNLREDVGARYLLNNEKISVLTIDAGQRVFDIDTPEEYEQIHRKYYGK